jgi:hypothetical protein
MVVSKKLRGRPRKKAVKTHKGSKKRYIEALTITGKKTYKI